MVIEMFQRVQSDCYCSCPRCLMLFVAFHQYIVALERKTWAYPGRYKHPSFSHGFSACFAAEIGDKVDVSFTILDVAFVAFAMDMC